LLHHKKVEINRMQDRKQYDCERKNNLFPGCESKEEDFPTSMEKTILIKDNYPTDKRSLMNASISFLFNSCR